MLLADKMCDPYVTGATINGIKRTMYFITTFATGVLRLPKLDILDGSGDGSLVCIKTETGSPCDNPETLFRTQFGQPKYAMFESSDHRCCPICPKPSCRFWRRMASAP